MSGESETKKEQGGLLQAIPHDVSHQEIGRIVSEIEQIFFASQTESLPVESIEHYLMFDLGYDDQNEFEDALHGTFEQFLRKMPNCRVWSRESDGKMVFAVDQAEQKPPQRLELSVKSSDELWRVFLFAPSPARVEIPELEFEIMGAEKNAIDSIYNHLARAITNLEQHVDMNMGAANATEIIKTIDELKGLLDMEKPFTWIAHDPEGKCEINPEDDVKVVKLSKAGKKK